jgi:hypothetical protein
MFHNFFLRKVIYEIFTILKIYILCQSCQGTMEIHKESNDVEKG